MKGPDGVAERLSIYVSTALDDVVLRAAPGAGWYIRLFSIFGTSNATGLVTLRDDVPTTYWGIQVQPLRPYEIDTDCGIFGVAANRPLILENPGLATVTLNLTYEIRPDGI